MRLWKIAFRSVQHRLFPSTLTMLSMALGVMLVVAVLAVHGVVQESFKTNASLGYNVIVGAKGGSLQLTLNTVYYLSSPVENIPYDYYLEFERAAFRDEQLELALGWKGGEAETQLAELQSSIALAGGFGGASMIAGVCVDRGLAKAVDRRLGRGRDGRFAQYTTMVIPVCLGDYLGNFRVVGTVPRMFESLRYGEDNDRKYEFRAGRNFKTHSEEHGFFEAVIGSMVAHELKIKVGDEIHPSHGDPEGHRHSQPFTVVGVLKPSGTPNDRAVFINMEGFYLMEDHAKPVEKGEKSPGDEGESEESERQRLATPTVGEPRVPLPVEQREVTALLVSSQTFVAPGLLYAINKGQVAQAVLPVREIFALFDMIVKPMQRALLVITAMICVVSGVSILVSIYNSMSERRHEIAVMRALGAGRSTVMTIILLESVILALGGGLMGWLAGHFLVLAASPQIEAQTGVSLSFFDLAPGPTLVELLDINSTIGILNQRISTEILVLPALVLLAIGAGFLPALSAYRTDVAKSLGT